MKNITQKELIKLIEEKQENAERKVFINNTGKGNLAKGIYNLAIETNELNGEVKAYQDLICYLNGVEIVPEKIEVNPRQFVAVPYDEPCIKVMKLTDNEVLDLLRQKFKPLSFNQAMEILKTKARWCEEMEKEKLPFMGLMRVYVEGTTLKEVLSILERVKGD